MTDMLMREKVYFILIEMAVQGMMCDNLTEKYEYVSKIEGALMVLECIGLMKEGSYEELANLVTGVIFGYCNND